MTLIYMFPGQGSQKVGMGKELFARYPELIAQADEQLGYSIEKLCLEDENKTLRLTQYTQPALYIVNALTFLDKIDQGEPGPDLAVGHSLGEYNALFAAGVFDFITGLKLVQRRGELMGKVTGSAMAAVIRVAADKIREILEQNKLTTIDIANLNGPDQTVIAGSEQEIDACVGIFRKIKARCIKLNVSAAFHSHYMKETREQFADFISDFTFLPLKIPVIANASASLYQEENIAQTLVRQITEPVRWHELIEYCLLQPEAQFVESGPGNVLSGLLRTIKKQFDATSRPTKVKSSKKIVFLYSGQGAQYYGMGRELYQNNDTFRKNMELCNEIAQPLLKESIIDIIYSDREKKEFDRTAYSHPALFMFGYSLSQVMIRDWKIVPDYLFGYNLGEYVAAVIAQCLSMEEALKAVILQASVLETLTEPAIMFAVLHSPDIVRQSPIFNNCWIAAHNIENQFALVMPREKLEEVRKYLKDNRITFQKLPISRGFHSPLIDHAAEDFQNHMANIVFENPKYRLFSSSAGKVTPDAEHLWQAIRNPIDFRDAVQKFTQTNSENVFLDIGPTGTMANFVKYNLGANSNSLCLPLINQFGQNLKSMAASRRQLEKQKA